MSAIEKLASVFSRFPGIGPRQAKRFVYYLLSAPPDVLEELVEEISSLKQKIKVCSSCFRYYNSGGTMCAVCSDPNRSEEVLIVVEKDVDIDSLEKSGIHEGYYFVLGGSLPILEKNPDQKIRSRELIEKVKKYGKKIKEIVLATSLTPEGENTSEFVTSALASLQTDFGFKISQLGRGLSTGTEIEYSDRDTLKEAFRNRN